MLPAIPISPPAALALASALSLLVVFAAVGLARGRRPLREAGWRFYFLAQSAALLLAFLGAAGFVPAGTVVGAAGGGEIPLSNLDGGLLRAMLLNAVVAAASFEAAYRAFPASARARAWPFLPAIVGCLAWAVLIARALVRDVLRPADPLLAALPLALLALAAIRVSDLGSARGASRARREIPLTRTTSLGTGLVVLAGQELLAALVRLTGWSIAQGVGVLLLGSLVVALSAVLVSNRLQRRLRAAIRLTIGDRWAKRRGFRSRLSLPLEGVRDRAQLLAALPELARGIAGVEPVTLFAIDAAGRLYVPTSSTLSPLLCESVATDDPLPLALRRVGSVLELHGRTDDLQNAPIYAVNGRQLRSCRAICAVPLACRDELVGFLLCGGMVWRGGIGLRSSATLEQLARAFAGWWEGAPDPPAPVRLRKEVEHQDT